ncbi:hypothetical protein ACFVRB_10990 [Streptomyces nojiriensis]
MAAAVALLTGRGRSVLAGTLGSLPALLLEGSPARAAVSALAAARRR